MKCNNSTIEIERAVDLIKNGCVEKGIKALRALSSAGDNSAKWELFYYYDHFENKKMRRKGVEVLRDLYKDGDLLACYLLSQIYMEGKIVRKSSRKAEKYIAELSKATPYSAESEELVQLALNYMKVKAELDAKILFFLDWRGFLRWWREE